MLPRKVNVPDCLEDSFVVIPSRVVGTYTFATWYTSPHDTFYPAYTRFRRNVHRYPDGLWNPRYNQDMLELSLQRHLKNLEIITRKQSLNV